MSFIQKQAIEKLWRRQVAAILGERFSLGPLPLTNKNITNSILFIRPLSFY